MTGPAPRTAVLISSGGMDSAVTAYDLADQGTALILLSFDYGQRHVKELTYATKTADRLGAAHRTVDLRSVGALLTGSALTDASVAVPDGHYSDATMASTVVPNRNAIMLNIAAAVAISEKADAIAFGAHAGDHSVYPDCRPLFFDKVTQSIKAGNEGLLVTDFRVLAPFLHMTKADIARRGAELKVPFQETWSCYKGGELHCGVCGTCVERREAFTLAGVPDPTAYETVSEEAGR
ncbi:7-cyano-7-deazaguanine synthase QueC [Streptomyces sp. NBC_01296]|uniref:7-cyano-7-deazaguanine synthase QueC n=1 Tax=Streptomyces sp. NBC_01296 TaxID=2903816 RepID=UPI002E0E5A38|nr:7-cyano-7-deazaguanine synthase QueC [Streptomyces sp. NBC_01296]